MSNDNAHRAGGSMAESSTIAPPETRTPDGNRTNAQVNSNVPIFPEFANDSNAFARVRTQAELAGCTLIELADGGYYLSSWSFGAQIPDLRAVGELLRQIGGAR